MWNIMILLTARFLKARVNPEIQFFQMMTFGPSVLKNPEQTSYLKFWEGGIHVRQKENDEHCPSASSSSAPSTSSLVSSSAPLMSVPSTSLSSSPMYILVSWNIRWTCVLLLSAAWRWSSHDWVGCSIEWYHTTCLKIKSIPGGKWYCSTCRLLPI